MLLPGLLLPSRMHEPLAHELAARGNRVITLDLLGHGESDRPRDMWRYSMPIFAEQVVALLDHLEIDEAVVGGTSLGANVTLEVASLAPDAAARHGDRDAGARQRPAGLRDRPSRRCWSALTFGEPVTRPAAALLRRVPRVFGHYPNVFLDWVSRSRGRRPRCSRASSSGARRRTAASARRSRRRRSCSAIRATPIHPFSDAKMLAEELPNGRLIEANSLFELRFSPERLTEEIAAFLDECWKPKRAAPAPPQGRRSRLVDSRHSLNANDGAPSDG